MIKFISDRRVESEYMCVYRMLTVFFSHWSSLRRLGYLDHQHHACSSSRENDTCVTHVAAKVLEKLRKLTVKDEQMLAMLESIHDKPDDRMTAGLLDYTVFWLFSHVIGWNAINVTDIELYLWNDWS